MNPDADTLDEKAIPLARDMTWHLAMAVHSQGTAVMWIEIGPRGEVDYGLVRVYREPTEE